MRGKLGSAIFPDPIQSLHISLKTHAKFKLDKNGLEIIQIFNKSCIKKRNIKIVFIIHILSIYKIIFFLVKFYVLWWLKRCEMLFKLISSNFLLTFFQAIFHGFWLRLHLKVSRHAISKWVIFDSNFILFVYKFYFNMKGCRVGGQKNTDFRTRVQP